MSGEPSSGPLEITVDRDRCVGSGNCEFWAPGLFEVADDGHAVVVGDLAEHLETARLAAENCPTDAIALVEHPT